jgi:hypothetical protein
MLKRYGENAELESARRVDELAADGDRRRGGMAAHHALGRRVGEHHADRAGQLTVGKGASHGTRDPRHEAVQGSIAVRPHPANPPVSRVAMLAPAASAVAAISASNFSIGFPTWRRAITISE